MAAAGLDELIATWLIGDIDDTAFAELETLLRRDPAARRRFAEQCCGEMVLIRTLSTRDAADHETTPTRVPRLAPPPRRRSRTCGTRRHRPRRRGAPTGALVAGLVAVAGLVLVLLVLLGREAQPSAPMAGAPAGPTPPVAPAPHDPQAAPAVARLLTGSVELAGRRLEAGDAIAGHGRLTSSAGARIALLDPAAICELGPGTSLQLRNGQELDLATGWLHLTVEPLPPGDRLEVHTPHCIASVVGTEFRVSTETERSTVAVQDGRVRVRAAGAERLLSGGEEASTDAGGFVDPVTTEPPWHFIATAIDEGLAGRELGHCEAEGSLALPAGRPLNILLKGPPALQALRLRFPATALADRSPNTGGLERVPLFWLFGDTPGGPIDQVILRSGDHRLQITTYADSAGTVVLEVLEIELRVR